MPPGISVESGVSLTLRDGVRLNADVYTPAAPGRYPTLLMRLPYGSAVASSVVYRHPAWYASQGFCVVVQDVRGTGRSGGAFYPIRDETVDTVATLEWAASLPRSNGAVGMYGFSYQGIVQLQAAAAGAPGLRCIAPGMTAASFWNGWHYEGGVPLYATSLSWALQLAWIAAAHDGQDARATAFRAASAGLDTLMASPPPLPEVLRGVPFAEEWFRHEGEDAYWRSIAVPPTPAMPALWSGGWYDTYLEGSLRAHAGAAAEGGGEQLLLLGPWQHLPWTRIVGARDFGPSAVSPLDDWQLRFFRQHLQDERSDMPAVLAFVTGEDRWRTFPAWPPSASMRTFFLASDGDAGGSGGTLEEGTPTTSEGFDVFWSEPLTPTPSLGGHGGRVQGCHDQRPVEARREVLTYTSAPLEHDLVVAGPVAARLRVASSGSDCDWIVRLCDVDPDGRSWNVTQGALRSRYRADAEQAVPLVPNAELTLSVPMRQCCHRFGAGQRIRVAISGTSFPHYGRNPGVCEPVADLPLSAYSSVVQYVMHGSAIELACIDVDSGEPWPGFGATAC